MLLYIPCYLCVELLYRSNERKCIQRVIQVMSIWALSNYRTNEPILRFGIDIDYMLLYTYHVTYVLSYFTEGTKELASMCHIHILAV